MHAHYHVWLLCAGKRWYRCCECGRIGDLEPPAELNVPAFLVHHIIVRMCSVDGCGRPATRFVNEDVQCDSAHEDRYATA